MPHSRRHLMAAFEHLLVKNPFVTTLWRILLREAGLTRYADDTCGTCPIGFYCPGSDGISIQCPPSSTTITQGKQKSDCVCVAGYSKNNIADDPWCEPCPRRKYKEFSGNSGCTLTCPAGSDSEEGSTSLSDCYCNPGFHADLDDLEQLEACKPCSSYTGPRTYPMGKGTV